MSLFRYHRVAVEEMLETEKLLESEKEAAAQSEFDLLHQNTVNSYHLEDQAQVSSDSDIQTDTSPTSDPEPEETSEEETPEDPESPDAVDDTDQEDPEENKDKEPESEEDTPKEGEKVTGDDGTDDQESTSEEKAAAESLRLMDHEYSPIIALESEFTEKLSRGASAAAMGFMAAVNYMGILGVTYGPTIAKAMYKGMAFILGKASKMVWQSVQVTKAYLIRRARSFDKLEKEITQAQETLKVIKKRKAEKGEESPDGTEENRPKYANVSVIDALKIEDSIDFRRNIEILDKAITVYTRDITTSIRKEHHVVSISANSFPVTRPANVLDSLSPEITLKNFKQGEIQGYKVESPNMIAYHSSVTLPGDVVIITALPSEDIQDKEEYITAYNDAVMFLGVNAKGYVSVTSVDEYTLDQLESFLESLDGLCKTCQEQRGLFENIEKSSMNLRYSLRKFYRSLTSSKEKIRVKDSPAEVIYLKLHFSNKVYLPAAIDLQDYAAKTITRALTLVSDHLKRLQ